MEQNRCVFCMHAMYEANQLCPECGRGIWEYDWREEWLEPGTILGDKYYIGAVLDDVNERVTYLGYDIILEQKVVVKEYMQTIWEQQKRREAELLFGRFDVRGLIIEKDYCEAYNKGYVVTEYLQGETLFHYMNRHNKTNIKDAVKMLGPVMEATAFLHSIGLVHGGIQPQHLIFNMDGVLHLEGDRHSKTDISEQETSPYISSEQLEGCAAPWTDVYALCAVLYEMITGRKVLSARERIKKDKLKRPSLYSNITAEKEKVLMQGLALDAQMRYFSVGNLSEQLEMESEAIQKLDGLIRHKWGDEWFRITTQTEGRSYWELQRKRKIRWRRAAVAAGIIVFLAGGGFVFAKTHQNLIFQYRLKMAQEKQERDKRSSYLVKGDKGYTEIRRFIEKYGKYKEDISSKDRKYYSIEEDKLEKCKELRGTYGTFYLDKKTVLQAIDYNMKIKKEALSLNDTMYYDTICIYADETETLKVGIWKQENYLADYNNMQEEIRLGYDITDGHVKLVEFRAAKKRCEMFLVKMLPLISPETFLTEKEAKEVMEKCNQDGKLKTVDLTGKCKLSVSMPDMGTDTGEYLIALSVPGE